MSSTASSNTKTESPRFILLDASATWSNAFAGLRRVVSTESKSRTDLLDAVRCADTRTVWITQRSATVGRLIATVSEHTASSGQVPRMGKLLALGEPRQESLQVLRGYFRPIIGGAASFKTLPPHELAEALTAPADKARDLFIGGLVDDWSQTLALVRGDFRPLAVPFSLFPRSRAAKPDFSRFAIGDYGQTLRFGGCEAAADFVLYALDPDFRRRSNARRVQFDKGFGPSLRRLRTLRKLGRDAFDGLAPKTIARIETGQVKRPHGKTLRLICETLGIEADQIETY